MKSLNRYCISLITTLAFLVSPAHAQWTEPVRISSDPHLGSPRVAVVGDTLHVSAKRLTTLYYLRSFDNAETWSDPICPVDTFYFSYINDIAYSNGRLHIAFIGRVHVQDPVKLFTVSSDDHGLTWEEPREVYYNGWKYPRLAASGDTLFLSSAFPGQVLFFKSTDNGDSWSDPSIVDSGSLMIDHAPNILYSQGRVHLIYQLGIGGDTVGIEIYYRYSDDHGVNWSDRSYLSTPEGVPNHEHSQFPSAYADSLGNLMALWFDYKYGSECGFTGDILGRVSRDNGETWLPETRLTFTQTGSSSTCLILQDTLYAIWMDEGFWDCGYPKLTYASSTDYGETWDDHQVIYGSHELIESSPFLFYNTQENGQILHCVMGAKPPSGSVDLYYTKREISTTVLESNTTIFSHRSVLKSYPNPFNSNVTLTLHGSEGGDKIVEIYNIRGRLVRELRLENTGGSQDKAVWDATDKTGQRVASGIYFTRARGAIDYSTMKLTYLK